MRTVLVISGASLLLAACGGSRHSKALQVVAAENAYGNIAAQIGGSHVSVTSILTSPSADPHLFEPTTSDGLAVAEAGVVIENGLGYDAFMTKLVNASPSKRRIVVTVADVVGVHGKEANPHLWYDVPALEREAVAIETALVQADPAHAVAYRAGLARFAHSLVPLRREVARIRGRYGGAPVAYTEPVPGYLVAAADLRNLAPAAFTRGIEEGTEPPPAALAAMDELISKKRIRVLLYNSQAVSPLTAHVRDAALAAGIPVVAVTETLPAGRTFQAWQLRQAHALATALGDR